MPIKHDDLCPCTRFRAQPEFCTCNAIAYDDAVEKTSQNFSRRLKGILSTPSKGK